MLLSIVNIKFSNRLHAGLFCHPPNSPANTLEFLCNCLQGVNVNFFFFVLLEDFDVKFPPPSLWFMHSFSLTPTVQEDTHTSLQGNTSLIDLALVYETSLLSSCDVIPPLGTSDHNGTQCSLKWKSNNPFKANPRKVWQYKLADFDTANDLLDPIDWDNLLSGDINQGWDNWKQTFLSVMEQCTTHTTIKSKHNLPRINIGLTKTMRARNLAYNNPCHWHVYKKKQKQVANELKRAS